MVFAFTLQRRLQTASCVCLRRIAYFMSRDPARTSPVIVMDVGDSCVVRVERHEVGRSTSLVEAVLLLSVAIFVFDQKAYRISPRPDGIFPDTTRRWGAASPPPPPLSAKLLDRFSIQKRDLIAPGLIFPNMLQNFMWRSLMTSQVGSKVKLLIICPCWPRRANQPHQIEIKSMERHGSCLGYF